MPWGVLVAYLVWSRRQQWLLIWHAFLCNVVAWIVALIVFALAIASAANKEDNGLRALIPIVGIVVSLMLFGLLQFAGWLPGIPRGQRSRALKLLLIFPTLLALSVWYVGLIFQTHLNAAFSLGTSTLILFSSPFVPAAILTACTLAHYLRRGLQLLHLTSAEQLPDRPIMIADADGDTRP